MRAHPQPRDRAGPLLAGIIPVAAYLTLEWRVGPDGSLSSLSMHLPLVTAISIPSAVLAAFIARAGYRLRNVQVTLLALALLSLAIVSGVHGLATPGFLLPAGPLPALAAQLSVLLAAVWLALSALPSDSPFLLRLSWRSQQVLMPAWAALLLVAGVVVLRVPSIVEGLPQDDHLFRPISAALTLAMLAYALARYWNAYLWSRMPLQRSLVYTALWLLEAQIIIVGATMWALSWWLYHLLIFLAATALLVGLLRQHAAGASVDRSLKVLFEEDPVRRQELAISDPVQALVLATETRDPYTAGHSLRMAREAVRLGAELSLSPEQLRALAQGSLVHDVGKLEVPDAILRKPGPLTPEERRVVEQHPLKGYEMCRRLGFLRPELEIVRHHHERWDGSGYPDGLAGEEIPLLARLVAIVDVYDALTSERVYRPAWPESKARRYIREGAGHLFDPRCVEAWDRIRGQSEKPGSGWLRESVQVTGEG